MQAPQISTFVFYIGYVVQLVGAVMLVALFALLRRFVLRRAYFNAWAMAWGSLAFALFAVVLRHHLPPGSPLARGAAHPAANVLPIVYQFGKLVAFALFVEGTRLYVRGRGSGRLPVVVWPFAAVFAVGTVLLSTPQVGRMQYQAVVAVATLGWCAAAMLRLPRSRRTFGSLATGTGFALTALLWLGYGVLYTVIGFGLGGPWQGTLQGITQANAYLDLFCNVWLAYAMVVVLMEDSKREVDDAQAELRVVHDQLRRAALYDTLTESLNRRAFVEGVGLDMAKSSFGTVVLLDLDNMKAVNDAWGHAAGDQLLRVCADVVRGGLRASDRLYRWGGDEFLVVLPGAHPGDVQARLEALLAAAEVPPLAEGAPSMRLEVSVGTDQYAGAEQLERAIERADAAMYRRKAERKARVRATPVTAEVAVLPTASPRTVVES